MKSRWTRLLPVMIVAFMIAFMDRTNISFAIPTMGRDLGLTPSQLGFSAGVLFLGYGLAQLIGGWIADRGHGKLLITVTLVVWGFAEIAQAYVKNADQLAVVRVVLGLAEGGMFPTFMLFINNWFSPSEQTRANGIWQICYPLAAMVSGPLAGVILRMGNWRDLFIVEGIFPLVWVAAWVWGVADSPAKAKVKCI
ncbi:major facilitator transporter [Caballeronia udeis]|uniref:Major facilitator transporter n=1 Tax=Caballeronia udeis TaxID=1232866 RepID=A0A158JH94_9BURK|nr:MFS transporter [Caballeronia udeis]SAL68242.1 major facilitator transporter [Caballeronia udeis]